MRHCGDDYLELPNILEPIREEAIMCLNSLPEEGRKAVLEAFEVADNVQKPLAYLGRLISRWRRGELTPVDKPKKSNGQKANPEQLHVRSQINGIKQLIENSGDPTGSLTRQLQNLEDHLRSQQLSH